MKKLILLTSLLLIFFTSLSFSQTQQFDYKKVDYIQVDMDKSTQFLKMAEDVIQPAYRKMLDSGAIKSWRLYMVNYPGGQRSTYNYVSIVTASEIDTIEEAFSKKKPLYFMPVSSDENTAGNMATMTSLVGSEIWKVISLLPEDIAKTKPGKYLMMDYMQVPEGNGPGYLTLEDQVAMPIHQQRVEDNYMVGWEVYSLMLPGGTEYGYNYATGNFFDKIAHVEFGFTQELIDNALPGTNVSELFKEIYNTRELVKSELWELVINLE